MSTVKTAVVASAELATQGRWDAQYHVLLAEHKELAEDLHATLTEDELIQLVADLPFNQEAANIVWSRQTDISRNAFLEELRAKRRANSDRVRKRWLAAYCAAAAQGTVARVLEEVLELSKQKEAKLLHLKTVLGLAKDKGLPRLTAALKRDDAGKERK